MMPPDQAVIAIRESEPAPSEAWKPARRTTKSLEELRTTQDRLVQTQKLALLGQLTAGIAHESESAQSSSIIFRYLCRADR